MKTSNQAGEFDPRLIIGIFWLIAMSMVVLPEAVKYVPALVDHLNSIPAPEFDYSEYYHAMFYGWVWWFSIVGLTLFLSCARFLSDVQKEEENG